MTRPSPFFRSTALAGVIAAFLSAPGLAVAGTTDASAEHAMTDIAAWADAGSGDVAQGVALAKERAATLRKWMGTDPARVLAAALPEAIRAKLPAVVAAEVETPSSATGDYLVRCELSAPDSPTPSHEDRFIMVDGHQYTAHVYGRRLGMTTRRNVFLHGVILGNDVVLDESVLQELPASAAAKKRLARTPGTATPSTDGMLAEAGATLYRFDSRESFARAEQTLRDLEEHHVPETASVSEQAVVENPDAVAIQPDSAYSTGAKTILVVRADFSDSTGVPLTAAQVQDVADTQIATYYARSSWGQTSQTFTVSSKVYRLPRTAADYATAGDNDGLHSDARAAAAADFDVAGFDRVIVFFNPLSKITGSKITYGGLADVGGSHVWANGYFDFRIIAHELGHTYGLVHGNLWQVTDGNAISDAGTSGEYLDDYETMGQNYTYNQETDFNAWYKTILGWLPNPQALTVQGSGTYRVFRSDGANRDGLLALKIPRDSSRNYWVSVRRKFTDNSTISHGVYVIWGYNTTFTKENLLDLQTPGNSTADAALPTSKSFTDPTIGMTITPVAEGGASGGEYEDIQIAFNVTSAPAINSSLSTTTAPGKPFSYQITAANHPSTFNALDLPAGLSVDSTTGLITGTPAAQGVFNITLQATNSLGTTSATLVLTVAQSNDNFADATPLVGLSGTVKGDNSAATIESGEPVPYGASGTHSVWYMWKPAVSGTVSFDTTGSSFDTTLAAFSGTTLANLSLVANNDDNGSLSTSKVTFPATAGTTYYFSVNGYSTGNGNIVFNWTQTVAHPFFFTGETFLGNTVDYLQFTSGTPFGYYAYLDDRRYIYHFDLGYEFWVGANDGHAGVYLYDFKSNSWMYSSPAFPFPYLYDFGLNAFLYYYPDPSNPGHYNTNGVRYFFNFSTGQIITK